MQRKNAQMTTPPPTPAPILVPIPILANALDPLLAKHREPDQVLAKLRELNLIPVLVRLRKLAPAPKTLVEINQALARLRELALIRDAILVLDLDLVSEAEGARPDLDLNLPNLSGMDTRVRVMLELLLRDTLQMEASSVFRR